MENKPIYYAGPITLVENEHFVTISIEKIIQDLKDIDIIALDLETTGLDPHIDKIIMAQFATEEAIYVVDTRCHSILNFQGILTNTTKTFIGHNIKFDYGFLKSEGITLPKVYDTMLAEAVIFCGMTDIYSVSLKATLERRFRQENLKIDKEERSSFSDTKRGNKDAMSLPFSTSQINYGAKDVMYLHELKRRQEKVTADYGLEYAVNLENRATLSFADIEFNGMGFDDESWIKNSKKYAEKLLEKTREIIEIISKEPNIIYSKYTQINPILFSDLGYEILVAGNKTKFSVFNPASTLQLTLILELLGIKVPDTSMRELIKNKDAHKVIPHFIEYRKIAKIVSTYGEEFARKAKNKVTGRVHTRFWQVLNTFRVSSGDKRGGGKFPNVQNIPQSNEFRNCFIPRPGYKWVSIDYSSQELRLMADYSGEQGFIEVLNRGEDLHCYVGSMMTGKTITKEDKADRNAAKTLNFGKPYGMGPNKLADSLGISIQEAEHKFIQYAKAFPSLDKWLKNQAAYGKKYACIRLNPPHSGIRWFPQIHNAKEERKKANPDWKLIFTAEGSAERESMNTPIQGGGAAIMKEALANIREYLIKNKYYETVAFMVCTVHDQIDLEIKTEWAEKLTKEISNIMVESGNKYVKSVSMEVDAEILDKWQK